MNDNVSVYRQKAERLQAELQKLRNKFPDIFEAYDKEVSGYVDFAQNPDIQVAVVGAVKAGKSTLMNAILGEDITSTEVTPETAALTIFRYAKSNYIKVSFYDKKDWKALWDSVSKETESPFLKEYKALNAENQKDQWVNHQKLEINDVSMDELKTEVKKYSSSQSAVHYFVKKLEIGLSRFDPGESLLPKYLCFVDTPGLFDVVAYRANIARDYIDRANAVIVCVNSSTMRNEEFTTIMKCFENVGDDKGKVLILGTQIDRLNDPKADWEKQKRVWENHLEGQYQSVALMKTNVIGVSSRIFSLMHKLKAGEKIKDSEFRDIGTFAEKNGISIRPSDPNFLDKFKSFFTDERKVILKCADRILQCTNIDRFLEVMISGPLSKPEKVLSDDLYSRYNRIVSEMRKTAEKQKHEVENQLDLLEKDREKKQAAIEKKIQEQEEIKASGEKIKKLLSDMEKKVSAEIDSMKGKLNSAMKDVFGGR